MDASHRRNAALDRVINRALETYRAGLSHAVGNGDVVNMHGVYHPPHHFNRARGSRHDSRAQRAQVKALELGVLHLRNEHRGNAMKSGTALSRDGLKHRQRLESFTGKNHGCAVSDAGQRGHHHAKAVI